MRCAAIYFLMLFIFCFRSFGSSPIILSGNSDDILVGLGQMEILEDTTNSLTIEDIRSGLLNDHFRTSSSKYEGVKREDIFYWLRFTLQGDNLIKEDWYVELFDFHINHIEAYVQYADGQIDSINTAGYQLPFINKEIKHKNFVYKVPVTDLPVTYYFRIRSTNRTAFITKIRSDNYFIQYALSEYIILGMFYGVLLIMGIYNFLIYLSVREKLYLYYVLYVLNCIFVGFIIDGLGFQYIWPGYPKFNEILEALAPLLFLYSFVLYAHSFLHVKEFAKTYFKYVKPFLWIYPVYYLGIVFIYDTYRQDPFYVLPYIAIYIIAIRIFVKGYSPARLFIFGFTFTLAGILIMVLRRSGYVVYNSIYYVYALNIGLIVEVVMFSLALADRLKNEIRQKELAQNSMIQQLKSNERVISAEVHARTQEIKEKNKIIEQNNQALTEQNEKLNEQSIKLAQQSREIAKMNALLNQENIQLQTNVKELTKARVLMREVDFAEFRKIFPNEEACYEYLSELKWKNGFTCLKCSNTTFSKGQGNLSRRCSKCGYNESSTKNTIFHRAHFPIQKGFMMLFLIYSNNFDITARELSEILDLRQNTCWKFRSKILEKNEALSKDDKRHIHTEGWDSLIIENVAY